MLRWLIAVTVMLFMTTTVLARVEIVSVEVRSAKTDYEWEDVDDRDELEFYTDGYVDIRVEIRYRGDGSDFLHVKCMVEGDADEVEIRGDLDDYDNYYELEPGDMAWDPDGDTFELDDYLAEVYLYDAEDGDTLELTIRVRSEEDFRVWIQGVDCNSAWDLVSSAPYADDDGYRRSPQGYRSFSFDMNEDGEEPEDNDDDDSEEVFVDNGSQDEEVVDDTPEPVEDDVVEEEHFDYVVIEDLSEDEFLWSHVAVFLWSDFASKHGLFETVKTAQESVELQQYLDSVQESDFKAIKGKDYETPGKYYKALDNDHATVEFRLARRKALIGGEIKYTYYFEWVFTDKQAKPIIRYHIQDFKYLHLDAGHRSDHIRPSNTRAHEIHNLDVKAYNSIVQDSHGNHKKISNRIEISKINSMMASADDVRLVQHGPTGAKVTYSVNNGNLVAASGYLVEHTGKGWVEVIDNLNPSESASQFDTYFLQYYDKLQEPHMTLDDAKRASIKHSYRLRVTKVSANPSFHKQWTQWFMKKGMIAMDDAFFALRHGGEVYFAYDLATSEPEVIPCKVGAFAASYAVGAYTFSYVSAYWCSKAGHPYLIIGCEIIGAGGAALIAGSVTYAIGTEACIAAMKVTIDGVEKIFEGDEAEEMMDLMNGEYYELDPVSQQELQEINNQMLILDGCVTVTDGNEQIFLEEGDFSQLVDDLETYHQEEMRKANGGGEGEPVPAGGGGGSDSSTCFIRCFMK